MPSFRLAMRSLARRPGFVAVVVLTLATGIGANSAIFAVVNAVLLKPLPYRAPDRLAMIWSKWANFDKTWVSEAEFLDYQSLNRLFEDVGSWADNGEVTLGGAQTPESVVAIQMSANLLSVLGVAPAAGRDAWLRYLASTLCRRRRHRQPADSGERAIGHRSRSAAEKLSVSARISEPRHRSPAPTSPI